MQSKISFITIPSGKFIMGSTQKEVNIQIKNNPNSDKRLFERQLPQHKIFLPEFKISKYPITNEQFKEFIDNTNYKTTAEKKGWGYHFDKELKQIKNACWKNPTGNNSDISDINSDILDHPVVQVSWFDALEFCKWLSKELNKNITLPTEAQWEKSARGPKGNIWPWGNVWKNQFCNAENTLGTTTEVGKYSPQGDSFYGVSDMAGNVLEWTTTTIGTIDPWPAKFNYPYNPNDGREDLKIHSRRVGRGGTFQRNKDFCRCAFRFADMPEDRYSSMGFRVVENYTAQQLNLQL